MAKLTRKTQKIFSQSSSENGQFGSGLVGTKVLSDDPDTIQALTAWLGGWSDAVLGGQKLPPLEEMNGVQYVTTRQLTYLFEQGIPEYDSGTTYYEKSIVVESGTYNLYGSLTNNNLGNALTDDTNWEFITSFRGNTIIDYTEVKKVGAVNQIMAGRDYTLAELEEYFGAANIYSFNKFNSSDLGADETGNYDYTLGAGAAAPINTNGIMGSNNAISLDGTDDYGSNGSKFDDMDAEFTGTDKGFLHSFWIKIDATSNGGVFSKRNALGTDYYNIQISGSVVKLRIKTSAADETISADCLNSTTTDKWAHLVFAVDETNGGRVYFNGLLVDYNVNMNFFPTITGDVYYIGKDTSVGFAQSVLANEIVINKVCTQEDVDFLFGTKIDIPTSLQGRDFSVEGFCKVNGGAKITFTPEVANLLTDCLLIKGNSFQKPNNEVKIIGRP